MKILDKIYDANLNRLIKSIILGSMLMGLITIVIVISISNRIIGLVLVSTIVFVLFSCILGDLLLNIMDIARKNK